MDIPQPRDDKEQTPLREALREAQLGRLRRPRPVAVNFVLTAVSVGAVLSILIPPETSGLLTLAFLCATAVSLAAAMPMRVRVLRQVHFSTTDQRFKADKPEEMTARLVVVLALYGIAVLSFGVALATVVPRYVLIALMVVLFIADSYSGRHARR